MELQELKGRLNSSFMKTILKGILVVAFAAILLAGCGLSNEQIGETVKTSMQQKFDTDAQFKQWRLTVTKVQVLKQGGNRYQGIATVMHEGEPHDVPVEITADGSAVM